MLLKNKFVLIVSIVSVSALANAESVYECTPQELATYIQQKNISSYVPTPIPTPKEHKKRMLEEAKNADNSTGESCSTIFSDGLDFEFGNIGDLWGGISMAGALDSLKKMAGAYMDELKKGICKRTSSEYLKEKGTDFLVDQISEETGLSRGSVENFDAEDYAYEQLGDSIDVDDRLLRPDGDRAREREARNEVDDYFDEAEDSLFD